MLTEKLKERLKPALSLSPKGFSLMENVLWFLGQPRQKKELERNNRKSTVLIALLQKCDFQFDFF